MYNKYSQIFLSLPQLQILIHWGSNLYPFFAFIALISHLGSCNWVKHGHVGSCCVSCSPLVHILCFHLKLFSMHLLTWSIKGHPIRIISSASLVPMCWGFSFQNQKAIITHEEFVPTSLL